ncbi:MAG: hypothetical protein WKG07_40585 [Hymenobacter sp.]
MAGSLHHGSDVVCGSRRSVAVPDGAGVAGREGRAAARRRPRPRHRGRAGTTSAPWSTAAPAGTSCSTRPAPGRARVPAYRRCSHWTAVELVHRSARPLVDAVNSGGSRFTGARPRRRGHVHEHRRRRSGARPPVRRPPARRVRRVRAGPRRGAAHPGNACPECDHGVAVAGAYDRGHRAHSRGSVRMAAAGRCEHRSNRYRDPAASRSAT